MLKGPSNIQIEEYNYDLPENRIAKMPLADRDQSKLLYLENKQITEKKFSDLPQLLPKNSLLVFNIVVCTITSTINRHV